MTQEQIKLYSALSSFIGETLKYFVCLLGELLNKIFKIICENLSLNSVKVD